jgi:hypothetical protein
MNATIVAVDLAKNIFELAVADADWRIAQRQRLARAKFLGFFVRRSNAHQLFGSASADLMMSRAPSLRLLINRTDTRLQPILAGLQSFSRIAT